MNQSQLKYARERAEKIKRQRSLAIARKYRAVTLPDEERISAIRRGDFSIRPNITRTMYLSDVLRIAGESEADNEAMAAAMAALEEEYTQLLDELMLGDEAAAKEALAAFGKDEI